MLACGRDAEVAKYVQERVSTILFPPFTALGWADDKGKITAGIVFNCWNGPDVELTIANDSGLNRSLIYATAQYVFDQMKCARCSITVQTKDLKTYETALKFGFRVEGVKRRGFGDEDAIIMGMVREDCRWMRNK
jgi:hypothetical protein